MDMSEGCARQRRRMRASRCDIRWAGIRFRIRAVRRRRVGNPVQLNRLELKRSAPQLMVYHQVPRN
jgi:hypothetical protein